MEIKLQYPTNPEALDEMFLPNSFPREHYKEIFERLLSFSKEDLNEKENLSRISSLSQGITFTVYNDGQGIERIFPFDIIPRVIQKPEWDKIESGIVQRITALNLFLHDIYHEQNILKDKVIPSWLILESPEFIREMVGVDLPHQIHTHISGIDLIRDANNEFCVLEDNLRTPSGVSYVLENRIVMKKIFPEIFRENSVLRVDHYPQLLREMLIKVAPHNKENPTVVLLTPGIYNSAYYEHVFLAAQMGIQIVEARDLLIQDHKVYTKTIYGKKQVDVVYKRVDDAFIDPNVFRKDSLLGVPGLFEAFKRGNVNLVNAIGNGIADDKAIYAYVPKMIQYYLTEEPILKNIPTYLLFNDKDRDHVLKNMESMVVKATNQSGGYGMLIGRDSTEESREKFKQMILENPRNYIAQPTIALSTSPCFIEGAIEPRHVDLRPFAIYSPDGIKLIPGGLTRVALKKGSLVVNSSQGGGSKDTWVVNSA